MKRIGIIGGSGLYDIEGMEIIETRTLETPFGTPSDSYLIGRIAGREVVFLPRHGRGHRLLPSEVNYRANIWGMKKLGVEWLIAVSAVGSLKRELRPVDIVLVDQFVDRTRGRQQTFFGKGIVAHVAFSHPTCDHLRKIIGKSAITVGLDDNLHTSGTYVNMEGPAFSTRAESNLYRSWGMDVVGMTNIAEARLAREAEMCFSAIAMVTDYDCWIEDDPDAIVNVEMVMQNIGKNVANAKAVLQEVVKHISEERNCECKNALKNAIMTSPDVWPEKTKENLEIFLKKYYAV